MSQIATSFRSLSASSLCRMATMRRSRNLLRAKQWATAWTRALPKQTRRWAKLYSEQRNQPNTLTGPMKRSILPSASMSVCQATLSHQAPSHSSQWSRWAIAGWLSLLALPASRFTKPFNWTTQATLQFSTRSCKTQRTRSSPTHRSARLQASLSHLSALSSTLSPQGSTTSQLSSFSTTRLPTCNRCSCKDTATVPKSLWKTNKSSSHLVMSVSLPSRSSQSRMSLESLLSTNGECLRSTETRSISNLQEPSWCQMKLLKCKLSSLLSSAKSIKSWSLYSPRISSTT